ncbi:MAG: DEAD/DEAH box helicase [Nitrospinae bacterium]|nr:DEAD/DEAH box helicase [Nitrospinota bacterium]
MPVSVSAFVEKLKKRRDLGANIVHHRVIPSKPAERSSIPSSLHPALAERLRQKGFDTLYSHQSEAISNAIAGKNVVVATPTASGKTLCYTAPVIHELLADKAATAIFLFPLKALARDQIESFRELAYGMPSDIRAELFDGDVSPHVRRRILAEPPNVLFTNPDMLHLSLLAYHEKWERFFRRLKIIVVDEAHTYRGVFGSHIAQVLRRLMRVADRYGAKPRFIACSATINNPGAFIGALTGEEFLVVDKSGAPRPGGSFVFYNTEGSPYTDASRIIRGAMNEGLKTIAFTKARKITELIYTWTIQAEPELAGKIAAYRAGFLPEERRKIERDLFSGALDGVITTSALEMGVDIGGLDVCVLVGYPGTIISSWQRGGRVGRADREFLIILIAQQDALDQHFMRNPDDFFTRGFESAVIDPDNEYILRAHIVCAAAEFPIEMDDKWFEPVKRAELFAEMEKDGKLALSLDTRRWLTSRQRPQRDVDIRSAGSSYSIFAEDGKTIVGSLSGSRVFTEGHEGAVYLHMGRQYIVTKLDMLKKAVHVAMMDERYYTRPRSEKDTQILKTIARKELNGFTVCLGELKVKERVTGYEKRSIFGQESMGLFDLDMPETEFETVGFWVEIEDNVRAEIERRSLGFMGGIHAFEHVAIALFPLLALCDRDDIGGISFPHYPGLGKSAVFFYDGYPGGVGLSETGFERLDELMTLTHNLVSTCPCEEGCPSCVQSPKCGSGNKPLDKRATILLLEYLLGIKKPMEGKTSPRSARTGEAPSEIMENGIVETVNGVEYFDPAPDARIVFFDLETQLGADAVGGWGNVNKMRMAVGVAYDSREKKYIRYWEKDVDALVEKLLSADLVVGFNHISFDFGVLSAYTGVDLKREVKSFDILVDVQRRLGFRLSLGSLAEATLKRGKTADGLQSLKWWAQGEHELVAKYCESDVEVTKTLFEHGLENKLLVYKMKSGEMARLPVDWDIKKIMESAAKSREPLKRKPRF